VTSPSGYGINEEIWRPGGTFSWGALKLGRARWTLFHYGVPKAEGSLEAIIAAKRLLNDELLKGDL
jgi:hypothetical protein